MQNEKLTLDDLLEAIEKSKQGNDLLHELYLAVGPYGAQEGKSIPIETWNKVRDYFRFDDSE